MNRCPIGGMIALVLLSVISFPEDAGRGADPMLLAAAPSEPGASAVDFDNDRVLVVDGAEVARDTQAGLVGSTGGLYLGAGAALGPGSFWTGLIDDACIYNRAVKP